MTKRHRYYVKGVGFLLHGGKKRIINRDAVIEAKSERSAKRAFKEYATYDKTIPDSWGIKVRKLKRGMQP